MSVSVDLSKAIMDMEDSGEWEDVLPSMRKALKLVVAAESVQVADSVTGRDGMLAHVARRVDSVVRESRNVPREIRLKLQDVVLSS